MAGFLNRPLLGRTVRDVLVAIGILLVAFVVLETARRPVGRRINRQRSGEVGNDEPGAADRENLPQRSGYFLALAQRFLIPGLYIGALYLAVHVLAPPPRYTAVIQSVFIVLLTWLIVRFLVVSVSSLFTRYMEKKENAPNHLRPLLAVVNMSIWVIGILFLLDNLGFKISTIIAGIGIGGIAVALAAQAMLGDLFSYFVILFDRPFETGDFLIFDDVLGSIEKIGLKTTRIRSLSGEQIVVSNSILTGSRVRDYKRMERRRVLFTLGVTYDTGSANLRRIPDIIRGAIESEELTQFDRAHFARYGDSSLEFEIVYYVLTSDYNRYMDIQQRVNLEIYERFEDLGIEFAFPTRTVLVSRPQPDAR